MAKVWQERCDALAKPVAPIGARLQDYVEARRENLLIIEKMYPEIERVAIEPLLAELLAIDGICNEGLAKKEISGVKVRMKKLAELELEFKWN